MCIHHGFNCVNGYDFTVWIDGDCDKLKIINKNGKVIEGDFLLCFFAKVKKHKKVVSNLFTNNSYFNYLEKNKIEVELCGLGEKRIQEKMLETNSRFGADKFGSVVSFDNAETSDAFLILIEFLNMVEKYPEIYEKICNLKLVPQTIKKVALNQTKLKSDQFLNVLNAYESLLENYGKIIVRQDKLRNQVSVFVECPNKDLCDKICNNLISLLG